MKYLFSFILALFMATANAYDLDISQDEVINHVQDDWILVGKSDRFNLYIEKGLLNSPKDEAVEFHAYIEFNKPAKIDPIEAPIHRIYTYGKMHCGAGQMMMIGDLYTNVQNKIEFRQYFSPGVQIIDMTTPNTLRADAYNLICKDSI